MKANKLHICKEVFYVKNKGYYVKVYVNSIKVQTYGPYSKKEIAEGVARLLG